MLTYTEKEHIKDVLQDGLNIRRDINLPYFLDKIDDTNDDVKKVLSQLSTIIHNQQILDAKLDDIEARLIRIENR